MDDASLSALLVIGGLIALHAFVALAYGALTNVRANVLREQIEAGNKSAQGILTFIEDNPYLHTTYLIATTLTHLTIAIVAAMGIVPMLEANVAVSPMVIYAVVLLVLSMMTLVFGELVPEAIGSTHANALAGVVLNPMRLLVFVLIPLTWFAVFVSRAVSTVFRSAKLVNVVTEEEIMTLVENSHSGGLLEDEEKEMILSVLQLDQTNASEVMVPRIDMTAVDVNTALDDSRAIFIETGYSRVPVFEGNVDNIIGLLYAKDLLTFWHNGNKEKIKSIRDLMRAPYFVSEDKPADELLKELQKRRIHMAVVRDEYGGTAGIVTIENIIEEIIGDIQDEYDINEEAEYTRVSDGEYIVDAAIDLDDFNDMLDVNLPTEEHDTLGGYIYNHFGRVPLDGEEIAYNHTLTLRIESVDGRRIRKVWVKRHYPDNTADDSNNVVVESEDFEDRKVG